MIENLALMQDDNIVAGLDLVDQMGCPKHANALARNKAPHMLGFFYDMLDKPRRPDSKRDRLRVLVEKMNLRKFIRMLEEENLDNELRPLSSLEP